MNGDEFRDGEFRGKILSELESLKAGQKAMTDAFSSFSDKIGQRMGDNERAIERVAGEMNIVLTIGKWIFAPVFSVMGVGLVSVIGWYLFKK